MKPAFRYARTLAWTLLAAMAAPAAFATCEQASTRVSTVYPTAGQLPENLLRFYLYFSGPMRRDAVRAATYLADAKGNRLKGVFLDNREELWSKDSTRLTLLFDPGRVKTGLVAHNALGRALTPGQDYQLVVDSSAKDARGCNLASRYVKTFRAVAADYQAPDISRWQLSQPADRSRQPLLLTLDGITDHLSLAYRLRVHDEDGVVVAGRLALGDRERQWRFTPNRPWDKGPYQLVIDPGLEDIAGNRLSGLFDQPSLARESEAQHKAVTLPITLGH